MKVFVIIALVIVAGFCWQYFRENEVVKKGVYVIGNVTKAESKKNGYYIIVNYRFQDREYSQMISSMFGGEQVGQFVLLKLIPNKPGFAIYEEKEIVKDCLKEKRFLDSSWLKIPDCK